ncbi:MAG: molybdopterin-dependent oxidoreductase, partial [Mangrovicoccus sp.]|nr:molybdopterin-dependent oxidoreductase [Mangrovicoccus sp.]
MASLGKITRRSFLVSSVALAGGVAFGIYAARREPANPLLKDLPNGSAAPNAFVRIDGDGVTLITPRADKGQGVMSVQAHLIAEELDIDPKTVRTDPGQPDQAYFNGQLLADVLPFPQYDNGTVAEAARGITKAPSKWLSLQVTGGSTSVPDLFERLRLAGAVARETLKEAAARETGLDRADLSTEDGAVILPDGARIAYTALAARAAEIAPVRKVQLRPESAWRYLGKEMERLDIPAKSYGRQNYGIDMRLPGMLYATVRSNPGWGGAMLSYDAAEAEGMRGVKAVVPITNGIGVIADNTWRAFQAAEAVAVEWGPAPYPASSAEMWGVLESAIGDPESQDSRPVDAGDMDSALAEGTDVEAEYRVPYLAHAPLEPMNATVLVSDTQIEIWTGTQIPVWARNNIAKLTGYAPESIVIHAQMMGGSFGRRLEDSYLGQAVEVAMQMKGVPIKMTWSREEDFTHDFPRPMQLARGRGRVQQG